MADPETTKTNTGLIEYPLGTAKAITEAFARAVGQRGEATETLRDWAAPLTLEIDLASDYEHVREPAIHQLALLHVTDIAPTPPQTGEGQSHYLGVMSPTMAEHVSKLLTVKKLQLDSWAGMATNVEHGDSRAGGWLGEALLDISSRAGSDEEQRRILSVSGALAARYQGDERFPKLKAILSQALGHEYLELIGQPAANTTTDAKAVCDMVARHVLDARNVGHIKETGSAKEVSDALYQSLAPAATH